MGFGGNIVIIKTLRFGIPSLERLFGTRQERHDETQSPPDEYGIRLSDDLAPSSISIIGPDGTGKSVLGLHLASRYIADHWMSSEKKPKILYISTDLTHSMAERMWENFALDRP